MDAKKNTREIVVSYRSLFRVVAVGIVLYTLYHLRHLLLLLIAAAYMAVTLFHVSAAFARHGFHRKVAVTITIAGFLGIVLGSVLMIVPPLIDQASVVANALPELRESLLHNIPAQHGLRESVRRSLEGIIGIKGLAENIWGFGLTVLGGFSTLLLFVIFSVYLLIEGRAIFDWLVVFFSERNQVRINRSKAELADVIHSYVLGQLITSALAGISTYAGALAFGLPAPLLVAVCAAILDALPLVGFAISIFIAGILALTVSPSAFIAITLFLGAYQIIENYIITPLVYGTRLRMGSLVILIALFVGATFGGVLGALIVLPLVASYPSLERIWLAHKVGPEVLREHAPDDSEMGVKVAPLPHHG